MMVASKKETNHNYPAQVVGEEDDVHGTPERQNVLAEYDAEKTVA